MMKIQQQVVGKDELLVTDVRQTWRKDKTLTILFPQEYDIWELLHQLHIEPSEGLCMTHEFGVFSD